MEEETDEKKRYSSYKWIKFHTESWLTGTARQELTPQERSAFLDLLCLAKRKKGFIEIPNRTLQARSLLISRKLLDKTLQKLIKMETIRQIPDSTKETFYVVNWEIYQARN